MDYRLEPVDKLLDGRLMVDSERELAFAMLSVDSTDPTTLEWLSACAAARAAVVRQARGE
jgi:hypothetical protein